MLRLFSDAAVVFASMEELRKGAVTWRECPIGILAETLMWRRRTWDLEQSEGFIDGRELGESEAGVGARIG